MIEEELFNKAVALRGEDRVAFLDQACVGDAALRAAVEALLRADEGASGYLEPHGLRLEQTEPTASPSEHAGKVVAGRYKLLEQIGEGGMGTVWVAEQREPVKRQVALKLIKPGMDSQSVLARFEAERQALALMDHQNIAKVLDGGVTDKGRPFFVMELVKGMPLTEYCDTRRLSVRDRLELFVPICAAVQHAHQKGIIHRDLKPTNILVTEHDGRPIPKVIDFGLAKALGAATTLTERTLHTAFGTVVGTPLYMAPEQVAVNTLDVDTRSDVYSLGVVLYELLTGTTPLEKQRFKEAAWDEIRRVIREENPPRPSMRLSDSHESLPSISAQRHTEPAALTRLVRGELDWIVMKALEKDRNRRYETANGFSMDVQRYLAGEVVQACPPSTVYRFKKFVRRNKTVVVAAGLVLASLVSGIFGTSIGMWRAEQRRVEAEQARDGEAKAKGDAVKAKDEALAEKKKAEAAEEQSLAEFRASTDDAIEQLIGSKPKLGPQEKTYLEKTLKRWQVFADRQGDDERSMAIRAEGHFRVGTLWLKLGRIKETRNEYEAASDLRKKLVAQRPVVPAYQHELAVTHNNLGVLLANLGERDAARMKYEAAHDLHKKLVEQYATVPAYLHHLATTNINLGNLLTGPDERDAARQKYETACDLLKKLVAEFGDKSRYRHDLAKSHANLGSLLWVLGERDAARKEFETVRDLLNKLVAEFADVPEYRADLAKSHDHLGSLLWVLGERDAARKECEAAHDLLKKLVAQYPLVVDYQIKLGGAYCNFGINIRSDQPAESLKWFNRAIATLEPLHRSDTRQVDAKEFLRNSYWGRARSHNAIKKHAEALKDWDKTIELSPPGEQPTFRSRRALSKHLAGLFADAAAEVSELCKSSRWSAGEWYDFACICSHASGKIADKKKEYADRAMELLRQAVKAGWKDAAHIKKDPDLKPLQNRDDFKKLIAELEAKNK